MASELNPISKFDFSSEQAVALFDGIAVVSLAAKVDRLVREIRLGDFPFYEPLKRLISEIENAGELSHPVQETLLAFIYASVVAKAKVAQSEAVTYLGERERLLGNLQESPFCELRGRLLIKLFGKWLKTFQQPMTLSPQLLASLTEASKIELYVSRCLGVEDPILRGLDLPRILTVFPDEISASPELRAQAILFVASFLAAFETEDERAARRNPAPFRAGSSELSGRCEKELFAPFRSGESPSLQEGVLQEVLETVRNLINGIRTETNFQERLDQMVKSKPEFWQQYQSLLHFFPRACTTDRHCCGLAENRRKRRTRERPEPSLYESIERAAEEKPGRRNRPRVKSVSSSFSSSSCPEGFQELGLRSPVFDPFFDPFAEDAPAHLLLRGN